MAIDVWQCYTLYAVSLGGLIMTGSYQLWCGMLFILVSMVIPEHPENTYLGTKASTLFVWNYGQGLKL